MTIQPLATEATGILVQGNFIGTDSIGSVGLGNFEDGVVILNTPGNLDRTIADLDQAGPEVSRYA